VHNAIDHQGLSPKSCMNTNGKSDCDLGLASQTTEFKAKEAWVPALFSCIPDVSKHLRETGLEHWAFCVLDAFCIFSRHI
jgi:hypothetical protein